MEGFELRPSPSQYPTCPSMNTAVWGQGKDSLVTSHLGAAQRNNGLASRLLCVLHMSLAYPRDCQWVKLDSISLKLLQKEGCRRGGFAPGLPQQRQNLALKLVSRPLPKKQRERAFDALSLHVTLDRA